MKIEEIYLVIQDFFSSFLHKEGKIVEVTREGEDWSVIVEVLEDIEYTRSHAKRDLKAVYKVMIDDDMEINSFSKIKLIERGISFDSEEESDY